MSRCGDCPLYDSNVKIDTKCKSDLDYEVCISSLQDALYDALAIEIVRCKDCKHKQQCRKAVEYITHEPTSVTIGYKSVEWCSYGERREL